MSGEQEPRVSQGGEGRVRRTYEVPISEARVRAAEAVLRELEVDLSDYSDDYVFGFVAGVEAEQERVARKAGSAT
jgi:hypothetical protein